MSSAAYRKNFAEIDWSKPIRVEEKREGRAKRSNLSCPHFIADTMDPLQSQATGKMYDSKAALRAEYKQLGMVELGNDSSVLAPKPAPKKKISAKESRDSIDRAFAQVGIGS